MDDSINSGTDNKLPLFIGIGAIAVALLALLFAFKARGDAKALTEKLAGFEPAAVATKADLSVVSNSAAKTADIQQVAGDLSAFQTTVTTNFNTLASSVNEQGKLITGLTKGGKPVVGPTNGGTTAPVAGPGEYVVKAGDTGVKIAKANGVALSALTAANSGVNFSKLHVGQKIKLPAKK
jgi:LysM repeat protein